MRKIEREMVALIESGKTKTLDNTAVIVHANGNIDVQLHGNLIARFHWASARWEFSLAGWNTPTARSRVGTLLKAFGGERISVGTKQGQAHVRMADGTTRPIDSKEWF